VEARPSVLRRAVLALVVVVFFLLLVRLTFGYVQTRVWKKPGVPDLLAMAIGTAPFLAARWVSRPRTLAAHLAWWLCALLTVDVLAFAVAVLAPTHGHPSFELVVSVWVGWAKVAVVPAALVCLAAAALRGERAVVVLLGSLCLACQTVYTLGNPDEPLGWFAWLQRAHGA
jgi:hypothetical protein